MNDFFRTAIYAKNIPAAERALRLVGALGATGAALWYVSEPWQRWVAGGSALMMALTAVVGFCPACYFAGRRLKSPSSP